MRFIYYMERGLIMTETEIFIDVKQVAQLLKLSVATIRKWVLIKFIPYKKFGRAVRFSSLEIHEWMMSKSSSPINQQKLNRYGSGE